MLHYKNVFNLVTPNVVTSPRVSGAFLLRAVAMYDSALFDSFEFHRVQGSHRKHDEYGGNKPLWAM